MRRTAHYTTHDRPIVPGSEGEYASEYRAQPFPVRLYWRFLALIYTDSVDMIARRRLNAGLAAELEERGLYNRRSRTTGPAFAEYVHRLCRVTNTLRDVLKPLFEDRRSGFFRYVVAKEDALLDESIRHVGRVTIDFSVAEENFVGRTVEEVRRSLRSEVEHVADDSRIRIGATWSALGVLRDIYRFPACALLPGERSDGGPGGRPGERPGGRTDAEKEIALRAVVPGLLGLLALAERYKTTVSDDVPRLIDAWRGNAEEKTAATRLLAIFRETATKLRIADMIRVGLNDPKAEFTCETRSANWLEETYAAYEKKIVQSIYDRADAELDRVLAPFSAPERSIPSGLPSRTLTALLNFIADPSFERAILELFERVIDETVVTPAVRPSIHHAVSTLDTTRETLLRMFGTDRESGGEVANEIARIERSAVSTTARVHKRRLYALSTRRRIEPVVLEFTDALTQIAGGYPEVLDGIVASTSVDWYRVGVILRNTWTYETSGDYKNVINR